MFSENPVSSNFFWLYSGSSKHDILILGNIAIKRHGVTSQNAVFISTNVVNRGLIECSQRNQVSSNFFWLKSRSSKHDMLLVGKIAIRGMT